MITQDGSMFSADPENIEKIKALSDEEFETEVQKFDPDLQQFLRIVREK